jgi:nucleotide-binding universal stress UspA family protein
MKILIPTDFSKLSKVAITYGVKIAKKLNAEIILLYVDWANAARSMNDDIDAGIELQFLKLLDEIKKTNSGKLKISYKSVKSYPINEVIEHFAKQNKVNLIVMGTKGATGLNKILLGSNAAAVVSNSSIPVITVPEFARFKNIKHIVYASNIRKINSEMKTLIPFAKLFDATIHILHVISAEKKIEQKQIIKDLIKKFNYSKITFHISICDDIVESIDDYVADTRADIIAMFTHNVTFIEKFTGKSVTRQMAFHSKTPLLSFKR